jgi:hypothetical protein
MGDQNTDSNTVYDVPMYPEMALLERSTKKLSPADVLEMHGLVPLADELRKKPGLGIKFNEHPVFRDQRSVGDIAKRHPDIVLEQVKKAFQDRAAMVEVTVGDQSALVDRKTAQELHDAVHTL